MIGTCYRYVSDRAVAEDLAHDAFLLAMEKTDTLKRFEKVGSWLTRITVNIALHYLRDNHLLSKIDHSVNVECLSAKEEDDFDEDISAEGMMAAIRKANFTQEEILDAISQLPIHHKITLNLFIFEHYSHQEIAKLQGISVNTSKSHLLRARKKLQQILFEKSKQKKHPIMLIFPFFLSQEAVFDTFCRQQLSGFRLPPLNPLAMDTLSDKASVCPAISVWRQPPLVPIAAGVATVAAGGFLFSIHPHSDKPTTTPVAPVEISVTAKRDQPSTDELSSFSTAKPTAAPHTAPASPRAVTETPAPKPVVLPDSANKTESQQATPVVVKKILRKRHTIVIKDTVEP